MAVNSVATAAIEVEQVDDWADGVRRTGQLLVDLSVATPDYIEACIDSVRQRGPYIVLSPGLALAHARPEDGATGEGVVVIRLGTPVVFGHPSNDPVDLVFAFSSAGADGHLTMLKALATALMGGLAEELREASGAQHLHELLTAAVTDVA